MSAAVRVFRKTLTLTTAIAVLGSTVLAVTASVRLHAQIAPAVILTPGDLAVMAGQSSPALSATLGAALVDARPEMRLTAARVVGVRGIASLTAVLKDALTREAHGAAKSEEQRALDLLAGKPSGTAGTRPPSPLRTASALFPGFLSSLLTASGCRLTDEHSTAIVSVRYGADGRPTGLTIEASPSEACATALRSLVAVTLADPGSAIVEGSEERHVLLLGREAVACADRPVVRTSLSSARGQSDVVQPVKTKDVVPAYPRTARSARLEGTVQVEAMLTATGCVRDLVVIGSADASPRRGAQPPPAGSAPVKGPPLLPLNTSLDYAALLAMTQWQFTPAQLSGKPVDVVMTVSSQFQLDRK